MIAMTIMPPKIKISSAEVCADSSINILILNPSLKS
jgi:hypothetical protein